MKIFILEDDQARQAWFWNRFKDHDVTLIDSCTKIDKYDGPYELICLDHDLGGRQLEEHEDCGLEFVRLMKDRFVDALVILHSYDPNGADNMRAEHPMAVIAPFGGSLFRGLIAALLKDGKR